MLGRRNRIAFVFVTSLLVMLVAGPATATYPGSDGRLAFATTVDGNVDVHSVMPDGKALRRLTHDPAFDACPAYSADGKHIAYCTDRAGTGVFDIWMMRANGKQQQAVTALGGRVLWPDFSPDGTRIAFNGTVPGVTTNDDVFIINVNGTGLVRLTTDPGRDRFPVWSPDGSKIAFLSNRTGFHQVWVMDANGTDQVALTTDPANKDQLPDWSPGGDRIAYQSMATGGGDIYVMDADGTDQTRLTTDPGFELGTAWSPDGEQIAFSNVTDGLVYVMDADGSGVTALLPEGQTPQRVPAWQPRGDRL